MTNLTAVAGVEIRGPVDERSGEILTPAALEFVAKLHRQFRETRNRLLHARTERQARFDAGELPDFLASTREIRESDWSVPPPPKDLADRRVEITGPIDRKMIINALNSGARVFMADFEDATSPTWENVTGGQANLIDAIDRTIDFTGPEGRVYRLNDEIATLVVRPRGWHLPEKHILIDGQAASASLVDFGLFIVHNGQRLLRRGSGPYLYLPKLEGHAEARLWNDVFLAAEDWLNLPRGSIRATVLIETILAAFEMDEILYELRDHSAGLNAGRWDYIFSIIKKFRIRPDFVLPNRAQVTMTVPFMRAYTQLLVKTCHRRGTHAIGGMAAFVPSRRDEAVNQTAIKNVREDKEREAGDGCDGTWVAHPDLVPIATAAFDAVLGSRANQIDRQRPDVDVSAVELLSVAPTPGSVTEAGVRNNVSVGIQYLESWLRGIGAVAINNLMEDAATAEIARSQIWQWIHHGVRLDDGSVIDRARAEQIEREELDSIRGLYGDNAYTSGRFAEAIELFNHVALQPEYADFLTLPAYGQLS
jgi:malate synthase